MSYNWRREWNYSEDIGEDKYGDEIEALHFYKKNGTKEFTVEVWEGGSTKIWDDIKGKIVYEGRNWADALIGEGVPVELAEYSLGMKLDKKSIYNPAYWTKEQRKKMHSTIKKKMKGWVCESARHSLARKGIKTGRKR